ncbi:glycosyltransferase [Sulfurimonas sp.]|uniref:glycosyltransferase n=1 Tax=Sulfurimonas sp. TaxID=2022749 RepID=UPI001A0B4A73|nr:glycosyltransferase [Sulfurimonas sp.]MBE0514905.1 glycosyltransferase [Sulfurimonas sp.]
MYYLSIITVAYNNKDGLIRTRDSILPLPDNCEWIIIDAASTDGTKEEILEKLPIQDNIKWTSEPDKGIFDGMNKGIDIAKGQYLNFMNSGDYYNRSAFLKIIESEPHDADMIMYDCITIDKNDNRGYARQFPSNIDEIKDWACVQHQSALINKKVFELLGKYSLKYKYLSDYEHSVRAYLDKQIFFSLNKSVKLSYFSLDGVSTNAQTLTTVMTEYKNIQKKYFGTFSKKLYLLHLIKLVIGFLPQNELIVKFVKKIFLRKR